jgi:hypothetical protein
VPGYADDREEENEWVATFSMSRPMPMPPESPPWALWVRRAAAAISHRSRFLSGA